MSARLGGADAGGGPARLRAVPAWFSPSRTAEWVGEVGLSWALLTGAEGWSPAMLEQLVRRLSDLERRRLTAALGRLLEAAQQVSTERR